MNMKSFLIQLQARQQAALARQAVQLQQVSFHLKKNMQN